MKQLAVLLALFSTSLLAADYSKSKELYMPNEAGGYIVLTLEPCGFTEATRQKFEHRAYATESDSEKPVTHEGCWDSPDTSDAPRERGLKIIPLVNLWFEGETVTLPQTMFGPEKRRYDIVVPKIEVKPNT